MKYNGWIIYRKDNLYNKLTEEFQLFPQKNNNLYTGILWIMWIKKQLFPHAFCKVLDNGLDIRKVINIFC